MTKLNSLAAALAAGLTILAPSALAQPVVDDTQGASERPSTIVEWLAQNKAGAVEGTDPTTTSSVAAVTTVASAATSGPGTPYDAIIAKHAAAQGVSIALAHAVISVESNYRPNVRGQAGEIGLMQIKPATARMMGYSGGVQGLFNPETNIRYGMKYLGKAQKLGGGDTCGTILRYNAGHGAKRMNRVSAAYCAKVKRQLGVSS